MRLLGHWVLGKSNVATACRGPRVSAAIPGAARRVPWVTSPFGGRLGFGAVFACAGLWGIWRWGFWLRRKGAHWVHYHVVRPALLMSCFDTRQLFIQFLHQLAPLVRSQALLTRLGTFREVHCT